MEFYWDSRAISVTIELEGSVSREQKTAKRRETSIDFESLLKLLKLPCITCPRIVKCVERRELANKCPKLTSYLIDE
ncbi:MAG: hypothetical protein DRO05_02170 [Thermoproteota archaeon]|nr:MAG: hypothetical protein DRO05_02170 [Candidatus Korarchaeota archaeon]